MVSVWSERLCSSSASLECDEFEVEFAMEVLEVLECAET
jgi:hypothetical protein